MPNFFYPDQNNQKQGPVNEQQLRALVAQGIINPNTPLIAEGGYRGTAGQIPGLFPVAPSHFVQTAQAVPVVAQVNDSEEPPPGGGKAMASLVCGIISWVSCGGLFILPLIGFILGILGLKSERKGIAMVGICLNAIALVVLVLTSIVFLLPAVLEVREGARRMQCGNHEKEILLALHTYNDANNAFPPLYTVDKNGKPLHSWRVLILPHIGQYDLYDEIRLDEPWDSEHNKQFHDKMPDVYHCPSNPSKGCTYSVIAGEGFVPAKKTNVQTGISVSNIPDGTSHTIAIIEVKEPFCWMDPTADIDLETLAKGFNAPGGAGSYHASGVNAGMFDGAVLCIPQTIDMETLRASGTIRGRESKSVAL